MYEYNMYYNKIIDECTEHSAISGHKINITACTPKNVKEVFFSPPRISWKFCEKKSLYESQYDEKISEKMFQFQNQQHNNKLFNILFQLLPYQNHSKCWSLKTKKTKNFPLPGHHQLHLTLVKFSNAPLLNIQFQPLA